jgi:hypothetical protein
MSRFSDLIQNLEDLHQEDIHNSAQVFGVAATLSVRLEEILQSLETTSNPTKTINPNKITKDEVIARYGSLNKAYHAYKQAYGIKCRQSWDKFLEAIQGLNPPSNTTLEERVAKLEEAVKLLLQVWHNK